MCSLVSRQIPPDERGQPLLANTRIAFVFIVVACRFPSLPVDLPLSIIFTTTTMEYNGSDYTSYMQVVGVHFDQPPSKFVVPLCFALSRAVVNQHWNNKTSKVYRCSECDWEVRIDRVGESKQWCLDQIPPPHRCPPPPRITNANALMNWMPLIEHLKLSPKHGHVEVKQFLESPPHCFTLVCVRTTILRAVHHWHDTRKQSAGDSYGDFALFLDLLGKKNLSMTVILSVDQETRFHCLFLAFPSGDQLICSTPRQQATTGCTYHFAQKAGQALSSFAPSPFVPTSRDQTGIGPSNA
jgi:hypothetical protein